MEENGARTRTTPRETAYDRWQQAEGIPINQGTYVADMYSLEVKPWARTGQRGAFINLAGQQHDDAYVLEIGPGGQTEVMHHLFEAAIYVLEGRGATTVWQTGTPKQTVEWQKGSVFSPPINCFYQHFNLDGQKLARLFAVTNAPMMINILRDAEFVFNADHTFGDRFSGEEDYFTRPDERLGRNAWATNFIPDIRTFGLDSATNRGANGFLTNFSLSSNSMAAHCSQFPPGTYKKAHRHGVGAHVVILNGHGYSLLWHEGQEPEKVDWKDGSVLSPREQEYHQHFNTGPESARYLALRLGLLDSRRWGGGEVPTHQIEYEEEDPSIYELYERECAENGAEVVLPRPQYRAR
jgi:gentisate 1,2-dioxygenase